MGTVAVDPFVALAAVAVRTQRLKLITSIVALARRRPHLVVQAAGSLDQLSDGRLILGVGAGVVPPDFEPFGDPSDQATRVARMDEAIEIVDVGLRGEQLEHAGPLLEANGVVLGPAPVQTPRPPIWLGAYKPGGIRRAARLDGWIAVAMSVEGSGMSLSPEAFADQVRVATGEREALDGQGSPSTSPCSASPNLARRPPAGPLVRQEPRGGWSRSRQCAARSKTWWPSCGLDRRADGGGGTTCWRRSRASCPSFCWWGWVRLIRRRAFLSASTIDELRRLIVTITLPATLFGAFLRLVPEPQYAVIVVGVFAACVGVLLVAPLLRRGAGIRATSMPNLMAGFEAGMLGIPLFAGGSSARTSSTASSSWSWARSSSSSSCS